MFNQEKNQRRSAETIVAVATPFGVGGIHVVRLSGSDCRRIADTVFAGRTVLSEAPSHTAHYGNIIDRSTGEFLDDVLAVVMWEPGSYTCEDTVEFSVHGSQYIATRLVEMLIACGARPAGPGEFTLRAFLNGRLDLAQAEAVADLIAAKTEASHRIAKRQLGGNLSSVVNRLRESLLTSLCILEAAIDFPEEEIQDSDSRQISASIESAQIEIGKLLKSFNTGRILRDGLRVPIVGPPNSGKSSLFNYLLDHDRAIVTPEPGTTRDSISEFINVAGFPVELIDTAGLHDSADPLDRAGMDKSIRAIEGADIFIALVDGTDENPADRITQIADRMSGRGAVYAVNKTDLLDDESIALLRESMPGRTLFISALRGTGIDDLKRSILRSAVPGEGLPEKDQTTIANIRHKALLEKAKEQLDMVLSSLSGGTGDEFVAFDLKLAVASLGEITGEITPDDVLNRIFSEFCIGK